jgi:hypothetical protein
MRDVETLDALRGIGETERILKCFLNHALVGLHDAEALVIRLLGIGGGEVDERTFLAALRDFDVNTGGASALGGELF